MMRQRYEKDKEVPMAERTLRSVCLLIFIFSLFIFAESCSRKGTEPGTHAVSPRAYSTWVKTFNPGDIINSVRRTSDGGFIGAGRAHVRQGDPDAWIVKCDSGGNVQWQRAVGEKYQDEFLQVMQTRDNGYLATGKTMSATGAWLALIAKITPQGAIQWQKTASGVLFNSSVETSDGDFVLTGGSTAFGASGKALVIFRLGPDGECRWQKSYGEGDGRMIRQTIDGGYIVLGSVWGLGRHETLILKSDGSGNSQWQKQYRGSLNAIEQAADGGFLVAGAVGVSDRRGDPNNFGLALADSGPRAVNVQGWLLKLSADGISEWQKLYGGVFDDEFSAISKADDGRLAVLGNTMNYGGGHGDVWLLLIDENGTIFSQRAIGGPQRDFAHDVVPAADGGYIIAGTTLSLGAVAERALIAKLDSTGNCPGCTLPAVQESNSVSENAEISPSERHFPTGGQNILLNISTSAIPSLEVKEAAASYCPPEPKLVLPETAIDVGRTSRDMPYGVQMNIINAGAANLSIKEIKITEEGSRSWIEKIRVWITGTAISPFSVTHRCGELPPNGECSLAVGFRSPSAGEKRAILRIISNDPDTPVLSVPLHATVL